jgi:hypothetical protein
MLNLSTQMAKFLLPSDGKKKHLPQNLRVACGYRTFLNPIFLGQTRQSHSAFQTGMGLDQSARPGQ